MTNLWEALAEPTTTADPAGRREVRLTAASSITIRPVHWLWHNRLPLGSFALIGGREGIGKSTVSYTLVADITQGAMPGVHQGTPRAVIIAATEDSWAHTIVPRLMAAGADLSLVYRVEAITIDGIDVDTAPEFPRDLDALERAIKEVDAALVLLDPLMSRMSSKLDTHVDQKARQALEPLAKIADDTGAVILGIIHVNKSGGNDPLNLIMASKAFTAVARAVLFVIKDPENEETRYLGQPKNNLGRSDLPLMSFTIESAHVATTSEGEIWTSRLAWGEDSDRTVQDILDATLDGSEIRTAVGEAAEWLTDHLTTNGGIDESDSVKKAAQKAHHSIASIQRARLRLKIAVSSDGYPRRTFWALPATQTTTPGTPSSHPGTTKTTEITGTTETTGTTDNSGQSKTDIRSVVPVVPVVGSPRAGAGAHARGTCPDCGWPNDDTRHYDTCYPEPEAEDE